MLTRRRLALLALTLLAAFALLVPVLSTPAARADTILGNARPGVLADPDRVWVELGVQFSSSADGRVTGIRFYKSTANRGTHVGTLWTAAGRRLAQVTFTGETSSGWQTATFATPVTITRGTRYVASYSAPAGAYSSDNHGFDKPLTSGALTVPVGGGVYNYSRGGFPQNTWQNSNYYVDVVFARSGATPGSPAPSASTRPSTAPTSTAPTSSAPSSSAPSSTAPSSSAPTSSASSSSGSGAPAGGTGSAGSLTLALPRVPWEGGSAYWSRFDKTKAADWSDPSFFPIGVWWGGISSDAEAQYDKGLGLNTYVLLNPGTDYSLLADNKMYFVGGKLNSSFTDQSANWVGDFLDDEVDGRYTPAEGRAHLQQLSDATKGDGRFRYANFTSTILTTDMKPADAEAYVNNYTDAVSVDQYYYSVPQCDWSPYRDAYLVAVPQSTCRTSSSYGKTVSMLRQRDAADQKLQSPWQFVELLSPEDGQGYHQNSAAKVQGAVMNSIINEARGIVYFNQAFSGPCGSGNIVRSSQVVPGYCGDAQVAGAKAVNLQIKQLAPVLNTQSYVWRFGTGLNTMLKSYDGSLYVFAMTDGGTGRRSFALPPGVSASSVQVMFENRSIPVTGGTFSDDFGAESTYHIYKITP